MFDYYRQTLKKYTQAIRHEPKSRLTKAYGIVLLALGKYKKTAVCSHSSPHRVSKH